MEDDYESFPVYRFRWKMLAAVVLATASGVISEVAGGFEAAATLLTADARWHDRQDEFHESVARDLETLHVED